MRKSVLLWQGEGVELMKESVQDDPASTIIDYLGQWTITRSHGLVV